MKEVVIANSSAGNGDALKKATRINEIRLSYKLDPVIFPKSEEEMASLIKTLAFSGEELTINVIGGDGTTKLAAENMVGSKAVLRIIPAGSGNDFPRVLKDIRGTKKIDLIKVNDHYSINIASLGLDAVIADKANHYKLQGSKNSYIKGIASTLLTYKPIKLNVNGVLNLYTLYTVCNGRFYGNGIEISPNASIIDGKLNLCYANELSRLRTIKLLTLLMKGEHENDKKNVHVSLITSSHVESEIEICCNIDGEVILGKIFDFRIVPEALYVNNNHPSYIKELIKK